MVPDSIRGKDRRRVKRWRFRYTVGRFSCGGTVWSAHRWERYMWPVDSRGLVLANERGA